MTRPAFLLAALLAAPAAWSEGRSDAFLRCTFDSVEVTLAERGEAVAWTSGGVEVPASCSGQGSWVAVCVTTGDGTPLVLTMATGQGDTGLPAGAATLAAPAERNGTLTLSVTPGTCEALVP